MCGVAMCNSFPENVNDLTGNFGTDEVVFLQ
jgi:hypothetical protein